MKRKYKITNLFDPTKVFKHFPELQFESLKAFKKIIDFYTTKKSQRLILPITNVRLTKKLLRESDICDKTNVLLKMNWDTFITLVSDMSDISEKSFSVILTNCSGTLRDFYDVGDGFREWTEHNPIWLTQHISYENYETVLNNIVSTYNKTWFRFFRLHFDFKSFDDINIKELRNLRFRIKQLKEWFKSTRRDKFDVDKIVFDMRYKKTLFVADNLDLYVNREAFENDDKLFAFGDHLNHNGEDIDFYELAKLRQYIDLQQDMLIPNISPKFVDFYQNKKILGEYIEVPLITQLITKWF